MLSVDPLREVQLPDCPAVDRGDDDVMAMSSFLLCRTFGRLELLALWCVRTCQSHAWAEVRCSVESVVMHEHRWRLATAEGVLSRWRHEPCH